MSKTLSKEDSEILNRKFGDIDKDCIEYLERIAAPMTLVKKLADGAVDVNATLVACGAYELMNLIKYKVEQGRKAR